MSWRARLLRGSTASTSLLVRARSLPIVGHAAEALLGGGAGDVVPRGVGAGRRVDSADSGERSA